MLLVECRNWECFEFNLQEQKFEGGLESEKSIEILCQILEISLLQHLKL